ncbi:MAG: response regulator, partial [Chloroflexota bacterium]
YINGLRLMPQQDVPLEHGDELGFGQLLVRVSYSIVPPNKLATPEKTDTASLATVNTQGDGHRVIIADANAEIAIIYQLILAEQGYHVTVTASAREAAQVLKEAMPSVLVMDWTTTEATAKGTDAPGAIRLLRQYAAKAGKPLGIGVICQEGDTQAAEEAERSGAAFVLSKPVHASELLQGVAQAVNRSGGNVTA